MTTPVLFADVEAWAISYIEPLIAGRDEAYTEGVTVSNEVPRPREGRWIAVNCDGGPRLDVARQRVALRVRVGAATPEEATDLGLLVAALLCAAAGDGPVRKVTQTGGPSRIPDESEQPMTLSTFSLICRGSDLT